jgi:DNA-binding protein YbaB
MAGFFEQAKRAMEMRNRMKKIQRELESKTFEYENAGLKISVSGDLSVKSVRIVDQEILTPGKLEKLERTLAENLNKALHLAKDGAQDMMKEATKGIDLSGLMG